MHMKKRCRLLGCHIPLKAALNMEPTQELQVGSKCRKKRDLKVKTHDSFHKRCDGTADIFLYITYIRSDMTW